jgi:hypothetical protein
MTADPLTTVEYTPHDAQEAFHTAPQSSRWFCGGYGSGKSMSLVIEALMNAVVHHPGFQGIVAAPTYGLLFRAWFQASSRIAELMASHTKAWGIEVQGVELKDISLPDDMQRTIAKQAEAERERRAVIINSEGEVIAAENLRKAAAILAENPAALHLRTLNSINDISSDQSNTVVFMLPMEVLKAFDRFSKHGAQ